MSCSKGSCSKQSVNLSYLEVALSNCENVCTDLYLIRERVKGGFMDNEEIAEALTAAIRLQEIRHGACWQAFENVYQENGMPF